MPARRALPLVGTEGPRESLTASFGFDMLNRHIDLVQGLETPNSSVGLQERYHSGTVG